MHNRIEIWRQALRMTISYNRNSEACEHRGMKHDNEEVGEQLALKHGEPLESNPSYHSVIDQSMQAQGTPLSHKSQVYVEKKQIENAKRTKQDA